MGQFDKEYFFIRYPGDERFPALTPDQATADKFYETKALPAGQTPLIFYNGALEFARQSGVKPVDPPPDVLFDGDDLVVREPIAKKLADLKIPHLALQAAHYQNHKKKWYKDYWFLTFTQKFDCWDRKKSRSSRSHVDPTKHNVFDYVLNAALLQATPLHERLLFKMGGATLSPVLAHESIVGLFRMEGVEVISVADAAAENRWPVEE